MDLDFLSDLAVENGKKVIMVVLDGVGGLPGKAGKTSLETARTPFFPKPLHRRYLSTVSVHG